MNSRLALFLSSTLVVAAAACSSEAPQDPRISQLTVGMRRDSALMVLTDTSKGGDSLANIYRREMYLFNARPLEILFYSPDGAKEGTTTVAESTLTPVVLNESRVTGWGWSHFDSVARVNDIRIRAR